MTTTKVHTISVNDLGACDYVSPVMFGSSYVVKALQPHLDKVEGYLLGEASKTIGYAGIEKVIAVLDALIDVDNGSDATYVEKINYAGAWGIDYKALHGFALMIKAPGKIDVTDNDVYYDLLKVWKHVSGQQPYSAAADVHIYYAKIGK